MKDSNFEKLLNKNVKNVSNILNCKFKNNLLNQNSITQSLKMKEAISVINIILYH
jgi:hypothetical protein